MPTSKRRRKPPGRGTSRARGAAAAVSSRKLTPAQYQRRRSLGWALILVGVVVFGQHLFSDMGFFTVISSGWDDLLIGYPTAALLVFGGAVLLSKT